MSLPEAIQDKFIDIGSMVVKTSELDPKTKALLALASAVATCCSHCHGEFTAIARKFGATDQEIEEAEALALRMRIRCQNETAFYSLNKEKQTIDQHE